MPRYYFNVQDGQDRPDLDGTELPGIGDAREQAIVAAGEMIKHQGDMVWDGSEWRMDVRDEAGAPVFTLRFSAEAYAR